MLNKKICLIAFAILVILFCVNCVNATTYSVSNSTNADNLSKMISGDLPMQNGKLIKNGDIVKFKEGNYYGLNITVKKKIKLTTTKKSLGKVIFIGNNNGTFINIKSNKVFIKGFKIKNYDIAIKASTDASYFSRITFYNNGVNIKGNKNIILKNNFISSGYIDIKGKNNKFYSNKVNSGIVTFNGNKNVIKKNFIVKWSYITVNGNKNLIIYNKANKSDIIINGKFNKAYYNKVYKADLNGIDVYGFKNIIKKNTISKTKNGISVSGKGHSLINNRISNCVYGIYYGYNKPLIKNNIFKNNKKNIYSPPIMPPM